MAAIRTGRHYIGFEIDRTYCEIAERRIREEIKKWEPNEMKEKEINEPNSTDMNRKGIVTAFLLAAGLLAGREAQAQRTYEEMEQLTVNERVTMVVTVSEPVRPADISTDKESLPRERKAYNNSAVSMSTAEMTRYARRIGNSPAKIRNVVVVKKATFPNDKIPTIEMTERRSCSRKHQPEHRLRRRAVGRFVQR